MTRSYPPTASCIEKWVLVEVDEYHVVIWPGLAELPERVGGCGRLDGLLSDWRISVQARKHVEQYLANMRERGLSPAMAAKHYRPLQQLFTWLTTTARLLDRRWIG
jgi:hypothetical protein